MTTSPAHAGPRDAPAVDAALDIARGWAGEGLTALFLSGSHATGEAVWIEHEGRAVTLSDLDVWIVVRDEAARQAAEARAHAGRAGLATRLLALGIAAPLEVGFVTPAGLARLPAKPGTIELRRHARVIAGGREWLDRVPDVAPDAVGAEETLLLLENRAFELLLARPGLVARGRLDRLRARHGVLKAALDLAAVVALAHGELPDGAVARVARARALLPADVIPAPPSPLAMHATELDALWDAALAWRRGEGTDAPADGPAEWLRAARAWSAVWWGLADGPADPWARALARAARAPLARRWRRSLAFRARGGATPALAERLSHAGAGTPQHRVNGTAVVLVLAAALTGREPVLPAGAVRALRALGVTGDGADWDTRRGEAVRAWDRWILDGQRTADGA